MNPQGILYNHRFVGLDEIKMPGFLEKKEEWEKKLFEFVLNWFDNSDCIVQKTSGSTGEPKLIGLKKRDMTTSALKTIQYFGLKKGDTCWLCLPIDYIAGKMMVVRALIAGLNLLATPPDGLPKIPGVTIDFVALVPLQIDNLLDNRTDLSQLRKIIIGGSSIGYNLERKIQQLDSEVYATYGMTETCSHIALQRINGHEPDSCFVPLPGVGVHVDERGCLVIEVPELSSVKIITSDLAEVSERGFRILGRADHVINSGGIKISPELLEKEISRIIGRECLVIPFPDDKLGQKAVLVVEKTNDNLWVDDKILWETLKRDLKKYEVPKMLIQLDGFVRKENFKIDRMATLRTILENF